MSVILTELPDENILFVQAAGKLEREDYERFTPVVEEMMNKVGKVNMLVELTDFHGWDVGALWEDIQFDAKHFSDIKRLAIVGEKTWQKGMAAFCKPFTTAEIRYFTPDQLDEARQWLAGE